MSIERVDPECRPALELFRANAGSLNSLPLLERRAMVSALESQMSASVPVPDHVEVEERKIPGPSGAPDIAVRIYRPTDATGERPGIYYIHGGGMVVGGLGTGHADCLRFCSELGAVVVNVDYRLAPGHPHPAPGEDCYAGLCRWSRTQERLASTPRAWPSTGRAQAVG
jgi:acetyl esterase/lipase